MPPKANHRRRRPAGAGGFARNAGSPAEDAGVGLSDQTRVSRAAVAAAASASPPPDPAGGPVCPVCAAHASAVAVGDCGHAVCAPCSHRLRLLYRRRACVLCNTPNARVAVVPAARYVSGETNVDRVVEDARRNGTELAHDAATDMVFEDPDVRARLQLVAGFTCPVHAAALFGEPPPEPPRARHLQARERKFPRGPHKVHEANAPVEGGDAAASGAVDSHACRAPTHKNAKQLQDHLRDEHRAVFCGVCFSSKTEYLSMLPTYPLDPGRHGKKSSKLRDHMKRDHPLCRFCNVHVLDDDALFEHLQKNHESCHICERSGRMHEYFRNFDALEVHYRTSHFVCSDPSCRGVVFASDLERRAHQLQRHRGNAPRNARGRRLHVDISELHSPPVPANAGSGARGSHRQRIGSGSSSGAPPLNSEEDVRQEQERQAARRRGFLASSVVFAASEGSPPDSANNESESVEDTSELQRGSAASRREPNADGPPSLGERPYMSAGTAGSQPASSSSAPRNEFPDDGGFYERASPGSQEQASERNRRLVDSMRSSVDPAEFEQFRSVSGDFRQRRTSAEEYYDAAVEAFGMRRAVRDILPELAALLPNADLRAELVSVCARRNPPPAGSLTTLAPSAQSTGRTSAFASTNAQSRPLSSSTVQVTDATFPALDGSAEPRPAPAVPSRPPVAPPTRDQFPRLSKGNRSQEAGGSSSAPRSASGGRRGTGGTPTAASVLMQPNMARVFGSSPAVGAPRHAVPPPTSGFPALTEQSGSTSSAMSPQPVLPQTRPVAASRLPSNPALFPALPSGNASEASASTGPAQKPEPSTPSAEAPAPDVTDRTGAVWGAASAARAYGGTRKRGPGRVPAPAPDLSGRPSVSPSFPALGSDSRSGSVAGAASADAGGSSSSSSASSGSKPRVLDINAMARSKLANSALPKVTQSSGYGFSWERKKMRNKQREVKREVKIQEASAAKSSGPGSSSEDGIRPVLAAPTATAGPTPSESPATMRAGQDISEIPRAASSAASGDAEQRGTSELLDKFSYLTAGGDDAGEDVTNSFFGD